MRTLIAFALLVIAAAAVGAGPDAPKPPRANVPPPPPLPENYNPPDLPGGNRDELEPEITIKPRGNEIHEEYRAKGKLYMVKVTPAKGPPYYLIYDEHGNERRSDLQPSTVVPNWVIKRF